MSLSTFAVERLPALPAIPYSLKKLSISKALSQETTAFAAHIVDASGAEVCEVVNNGSGGCNKYNKYGAVHASRFVELEAFATAMFGGFEPVDALCSELIARVDYAKSKARFQKKGFEHVILLRYAPQIIGERELWMGEAAAGVRSIGDVEIAEIVRQLPAEARNGRVQVVVL
jgi:hypothetical protein